MVPLVLFFFNILYRPMKLSFMILRYTLWINIFLSDITTHYTSFLHWHFLLSYRCITLENHGLIPFCFAISFATWHNSMALGLWIALLIYMELDLMMGKFNIFYFICIFLLVPSFVFSFWMGYRKGCQLLLMKINCYNSFLVESTLDINSPDGKWLCVRGWISWFRRNISL